MWAFSDNSWWSRSSVSTREGKGIFEHCIAGDFNVGFRWSLIKWNLRSVVCSTPWFLVFCSICHVIDFHEHSTWWLGFEYDSFKATFPQRLPEFCQSPMALLTYSDDPWLPGWTRLLGQALPSPPNPAAWVLPVLSMTAPENCLPLWSGAGDQHIVINLSFHSTFTSCQDFFSTY